MKFVYFITVSILFIVETTSSAQSLERQVLAASGGYSVNNDFSISWTLGEVATETLTDYKLYLTQGFQQPDSSGVVPVIELPYGNILVRVFPNPVNDVLNVEVSALLRPGSIKIGLTDLNGRLITEQKLDGLTSTIEMRQLPASTYFLYLTDGKTWVKSVKILKQF